jgi:Mor family transcriptional regulator
MTHKEKADRRGNIIAQYKNGTNIAELANKYSLSSEYIRSILSSHGVYTYPHKAKVLERNKNKEYIEYRLLNSTYRIIADIINTNKFYSDIAKEYGLSRQRVKQIADLMLKAGINFPTRKYGRKSKDEQSNSNR